MITDARLRELTEQIEHCKASIRAAVEHPFRVIKRQFGHVKCGALPRLGQERRVDGDAVCAEQSVDGAQASAGRDRISAPAVGAVAGKRSNTEREIARERRV